MTWNLIFGKIWKSGTSISINNIFLIVFFSPDADPILVPQPREREHLLRWFKRTQSVGGRMWNSPHPSVHAARVNQKEWQQQQTERWRARHNKNSKGEGWRQRKRTQRRRTTTTTIRERFDNVLRWELGADSDVNAHVLHAVCGLVLIIIWCHVSSTCFTLSNLFRSYFSARRLTPDFSTCPLKPFKCQPIILLFFSCFFFGLIDHLNTLYVFQDLYAFIF